MNSFQDLTQLIKSALTNRLLYHGFQATLELFKELFLFLLFQFFVGRWTQLEMAGILYQLSPEEPADLERIFQE